MRWLRVKKDEDENGICQCKTWPRTLRGPVHCVAPYTAFRVKKDEDENGICQ